MINIYLKNKGIALIEILVAIAVIVIAFFALFGAITYYLKFSDLIKKTNQANLLAQEALEAVRNFRDGTDWNTNGLKNYIPLGATSSLPYGVELDNNFSPPKWQLVAGPQLINGFERAVIFEKVSRDIDKNIEPVYNTFNDDPNTIKVIVTVKWQDKEIKLLTYLTNWK